MKKLELTFKGGMSTSFKKGDKVWFISKFGDRVSGIYKQPEERDGHHGHLVISNNAFGPESKLTGVNCLVFGPLHHEASR